MKGSNRSSRQQSRFETIRVLLGVACQEDAFRVENPFLISLAGVSRAHFQADAKTRKGFEVKNSTDLVESLLNLYGLQNLKPTVNPGRRSTVMELASATPLDGHVYSNFRTAVGKLIFMAHWTSDVQFAFQQPSTQVLNPTRASAQ